MWPNYLNLVFIVIRRPFVRRDFVKPIKFKFQSFNTHSILNCETVNKEFQREEASEIERGRRSNPESIHGEIREA